MYMYNYIYTVVFDVHVYMVFDVHVHVYTCMVFDVHGIVHMVFEYIPVCMYMYVCV